MKRIFVSVTNDMTNDQRVNRVCNTLCDMGFEVVVLCRRLKSSAELEPRRYKVKRFRLLFNRGMLFYACFNMRLFFYLLFHRADVLLANDLDSLLANAMASKLKREKLYYDTHFLQKCLNYKMLALKRKCGCGLSGIAFIVLWQLIRSAVRLLIITTKSMALI